MLYIIQASIRLPLSHRHFCRVVQRPGEVVPQFPFSGIESLDIGTGKGEAAEGSNETLVIRKVLYMQYMA